jgi:hypothetical protein
MKKNLLVFVTLFIESLLIAQVKQVQETPAGINKRLQHEIEATKDVNLGYVPKFRLIEAKEVRERLISNNVSNRSSTLTWEDRGPYKDVVGPSNGNTRAGANPITSGRMRAMWIDLSDATGNTVWVGGVAGGLWKTTNISARPATWQLIDDFLGNLAIGSICQDPTNHNIMYFGTGEKAINADAVRGAGIWRSLDAGNSWTLMAGTQNFWNVSKMICDANGNLYVGCNAINNSNAGMKRFTKSSSTWTDITPSGLDKRVPDFVLSSTGRLHVVCGYYNSAAATSGYRYTDSPSTVSAGTWTSPATTFECRYNVTLAAAGNTLYALPSNASWQVPTIFKSTDGGANWAATSTTPSFTSGQAWFCMAVAVDPNNPDNVIVGSLDCYRSTNGGSTWSKISNWVGTAGQYVHADQQSMIWTPNNRVLVASDGGIHLSPDGGTTFNDRNENLLIKQFYSVDIHPTLTNYFIGGTQDNGTHTMNAPGIASSVEVTGGDGAFSHIDQTNANYQFGAYVYNQYRRSTNGGNNWSSINYSSSAGRFINPTDYDDNNGILYAAGAANRFVRWNNARTGTTFSNVTMNNLNNGIVSAVRVSPHSNNTVYFAGQGSSVAPTLIKATDANTTPVFTNIATGLPTNNGAYISSISLGTDENNIVVTFSNYGLNNVWVTTDGGSTWSGIDGNLPDMPVRWAMYYPGENSKLIIATETGVWQTDAINGSSTAWIPEPSFPNTRTDMLQYRANDGLIAAATHGRGIFTANLSSSYPICQAPIGLTSNGITTSSATVSWTAVSGASSYQVEYKLSTASTWTVLTSSTTATNANITSLAEGTLYDWRVRANCDSSVGNYSQAQFTTSVSVTCGSPTNLTSSNITTTSATISWSAVSGASNYQVEIKVSSASTWMVLATTLSSTSASISGLSEGTIYDWRIRANCSGTESNYSQAQFTTIGNPTCDAPTGLISSNITTTSASVSWSAVSGASNYRVEYKLSSSSTWTVLTSSTTATNANITGLIAGTLYDWQVRANCSGTDGNYTQAQFTTQALPTCAPPTGLASSNITTTSASVSWSAVSGASNYRVEYKLSSSSTWTVLTSSTTATNANITGLIAGTLYDWQVRANCSGTDGNYTQAQFTTQALPTCAPPTGLASSNITTTSASVSWSAVSGASNYRVEYKLSSASTWTVLTTSTTSTTANITGLSASTLYDWQVRANCSGIDGNYTQAQFTTLAPPPCVPPTGLASSNINTNSASVSWSVVSGASNYRVEYKLSSASTWTVLTTSTTSTSANITGLSAGTNYDWRVRANCSGTDGNYAQAQFTTQATSGCAAPSGLLSSNIATTSATLSWSPVGGASNYRVQYKLSTSSSWLTLVSSTTSTSANITGLTASRTYDWRVRANCSGTNGSYATAQFATLGSISCAAPSGLASSNITTNSATVNWSAVNGASNYSIEYKLNTTSTWTVLSASTTSTSANITGLTASSLYDWRVRANCSGTNGNYSQAQFTTLAAPTCAAPTGLASSNIAATTATVSWNAVSGAVNYSVDIKVSSSSTWTTLSSSFTTTSANVTGLVAATVYDWRVRTNCSSLSSVYSQSQFTTIASGNACPGSFDVSTNGTISGAATIPFNTDIFGTIAVSNERDHYRFIITTSGTATVTLTNLPAHYDLYILNSGGSQLAQSRASGTNNESISRSYTPGTYYAQVRPRNNGQLNATQCYTLKVQLGTATEANLGVESISHLELQTTINIFPNPAQDRLNIYKIGPEQHKMVIYDVQGKLVYEQKLTDMLTTLDIQDLKSGIYLVRVMDGNDKEVTNQKLVKE